MTSKKEPADAVNTVTFRALMSKARKSWTVLLAFIYTIGGFIESKLDFVDNYVPEDKRWMAWTAAVLLIVAARMRGLVGDVKKGDD